MDDLTLYAKILSIASSWEVARVELDDAGKAVHVWVEARSGAASSARATLNLCAQSGMFAQPDTAPAADDG
jgi:hypothetical protein